MPLDPALVLADIAVGEPATTQATRELLAAARRIGPPVVVHCDAWHAASALVAQARLRSPRAIVATAGGTAAAVAARVAVRLRARIVTEVIDLEANRGRLRVVQRAGGGCRIASDLRDAGSPVVITLAPGAIRTDPVDDAEHVYITANDIPADLAIEDLCARRPRVLGRIAPSGDGGGRDPVLGQADVVVAGGRGVGSAEGFNLLSRVARALGGCLGGTHTAGELGWCPAHARISLPGRQIRPRLYLAGGVSGSLRHRAAIRGARTVVVIDRDPAAPIFRDADFGIVGDLHEVLPAFLAEIDRRRHGPGGHDR